MKTIFESNFWVRILKFEEVRKAQQNKHCCNLIKFGKFWRLTFQFSPWSQLHKSKVGKITNLSSQINETSMSEYFRVGHTSLHFRIKSWIKYMTRWFKSSFSIKKKNPQKIQKKITAENQKSHPIYLFWKWCIYHQLLPVTEILGLRSQTFIKHSRLWTKVLSRAWRAQP